MYATNHVPPIDLTKSTTGCCTLIEPEEWDGQTIVFDDKLFAKATVRSFMYVPLNMGSVMKKTQAKIDAANARVDDFVILSYDASPWHSEQYLAVSDPVPGLEMTRLTGTYLTKVYEGQYKDAGKWHKQLLEYASSKGKKATKTYFFYTTCPKCAKTYGKNYVVGFAQVEEAA